MKEEANEIQTYLAQKYGHAVHSFYVDVQNKEMERYPAIAKILGMVNLPLTVINGEPRFHGGLSEMMIERAIEELLACEGKCNIDG